MTGPQLTPFIILSLDIPPPFTSQRSLSGGVDVSEADECLPLSADVFMGNGVTSHTGYPHMCDLSHLQPQIFPFDGHPCAPLFWASQWLDLCRHTHIQLLVTQTREVQ